MVAERKKKANLARGPVVSYFDCIMKVFQKEGLGGFFKVENRPPTSLLTSKGLCPSHGAISGSHRFLGSRKLSSIIFFNLERSWNLRRLPADISEVVKSSAILVPNFPVVPFGPLKSKTTTVFDFVCADVCGSAPKADKRTREMRSRLGSEVLMTVSDRSQNSAAS